MPKQLTTQNATITTATVEVKTLTISGKQVTLALFRQLREEPLIAHDGTLNGVPWGTVNYHPDKCSGDNHWHIVWQRGSELLRSSVGREAPRGTFWSETGDEFISAHVREVLEGRGRYFNGTMPSSPDGMVTIKEAPFPVEMEYDAKLKNAVNAWWGWHRAASQLEQTPDNESCRNSTAYWRERLARGIELLSCAPPEPHEVDELFATLKAEIKAEAERRQRHRDLRVTLAELPQLFIAV